MSTAWVRWFEPHSTATLALFRIAFGLLVAAWTLSLAPNLFAFDGTDGVEPGQPGRAAGERGLLTAFYCMLVPTGAAVSVDRLRTAQGGFWRFPTRPPWALRLVQIQLSVGYLSAVWQKVQVAAWQDGTAVSYALPWEDVRRFPTPEARSATVRWR